MSGLAAVFERRGEAASERLLESMLDRLAHRGPDRRGHHVAGPLALGHAMLSITDEDELDRQPRRSADGACHIIADARLDNREELLRLRAEDGPATAYATDSEIVLWAYQRWGEACPARLLGDFAFVVWDGGRQRLFCARDHVGVRPLYYHLEAATFRCASEMHALFADDRLSRRPSSRQVGLFLANLYTERQETLYEGVLALPPGCSLTVTSEGTELSCYWQPDASRSIRYADDGDYAAHFREVFAEAVRCRLRSSRPVSAEVSGGLDSSSIACEADRGRRERGASPSLTLLRATFPGLSCDETPFSDAVAEHLDLPIVTLRPLDEPELCRPDLREPDVYFEPTLRFAVPMLRAAAARGIRTTLGGFGGDDLMTFTGYEALGQLRRGRLREAIAESGLAGAPFARSTWAGLAREVALAYGPGSLIEGVRRLRGWPRSAWRWISPRASEEAADRRAENTAAVRALGDDPTTRVLAYDLNHRLCLALAVNDRAAAAHGLEYRYPFLDPRLVDLMMAFPHEQRADRGLQKPVLRRAMVGTLPEQVRTRRDKAEFTPYLRAGFFEPHRGELRALFATSRLEAAGLIDARPLRQAIDESSVDDSTLDGLTLATCMELWLRSAVAS